MQVTCGMGVSLRLQVDDMFLSSAGIADPRITLRARQNNDTPILKFDRCVFRFQIAGPGGAATHAPSNTKAGRDAAAAGTTGSQPVGGATSQNGASTDLAGLFDGQTTTSTTNVVGNGGPLAFGKVVHIVHVYSGLYVTIQRSKPTDLNASNYRVVLMRMEDAGSACRFRILPRYKIRAEGDPVFSDDVVYLQQEASQLSLSGSAERYGNGPVLNDLSEVTAAETPTALVVTRYDYGEDVTERHPVLSAGVATMLFHREKDALLTVPSELEDPYQRRDKDKNPQQRTMHLTATSERSRKLEAALQSRKDRLIQPFFKHMDLPVSTLSIDNLNITCNSLWFFEKTDPTSGGPIDVCSECRIRHGATGKYVVARQDTVTNRTEVSLVSLVTQSDFMESIFELVLVASSVNSSQILSGKSFVVARHQRTEKFVSTEPITESASGLALTEHINLEDTLAIVTVPREKQQELSFLIGNIEFLNKYRDEVSSVTNKSELTDPKTARDTTAVHRVIERAKASLSALIRFCTESEQDDPLKREGLPSSAHQQSMFEVSLHETALKVLLCPFVDASFQLADVKDKGPSMSKSGHRGSLIGDAPNSPRNSSASAVANSADPPSPRNNAGGSTTGDGSGAATQTRAAARREKKSTQELLKGGVMELSDVKPPSDKSAVFPFESIHMICRYCYRLLKQMSKSCRHTSLLVPYIQLMKDQEGLGLHIADTLREIFTDNPSLPAEQCRNDIEHFIKNLCTSRSSGYVTFLSRLCVVNGAGVLKNQQLVSDLVLNKHSTEILLNTRMREDGKIEILIPPSKKKSKSGDAKKEKKDSGEKDKDGAKPASSSPPPAGAGPPTASGDPSKQQPSITPKLLSPTASDPPAAVALPQWFLLSDFLRVGDSKLVKFFIACIELFGSLCIGSSDGVLRLVETVMPLEQVRAVLSSTFEMDESKTTLRASFFRLAMHLYVRRGLLFIQRFSPRTLKRTSCGTLAIPSDMILHTNSCRASPARGGGMGDPMQSTGSTNTSITMRESSFFEGEEILAEPSEEDQIRLDMYTDALKEIKRLALYHLQENRNKMRAEGVTELVEKVTAVSHMFSMQNDLSVDETRDIVAAVIGLLTPAGDINDTEQYKRKESTVFIMAAKRQLCEFLHSVLRQEITIVTEEAVALLVDNTSISSKELERFSKRPSEKQANEEPLSLGAREAIHRIHEGVEKITKVLFPAKETFPVFMDLLFYDDKNLVSTAMDLVTSICNAGGTIAARVAETEAVTTYGSISAFKKFLHADAALRQTTSMQGGFSDEQTATEILQALTSIDSQYLLDGDTPVVADEGPPQFFITSMVGSPEVLAQIPEMPAEPKDAAPSASSVFAAAFSGAFGGSNQQHETTTSGTGTGGANSATSSPSTSLLPSTSGGGDGSGSPMARPTRVGGTGRSGRSSIAAGLLGPGRGAKKHWSHTNPRDCELARLMLQSQIHTPLLEAMRHTSEDSTIFTMMLDFFGSLSIHPEGATVLAPHIRMFENIAKTGVDGAKVLLNIIRHNRSLARDLPLSTVEQLVRLLLHTEDPVFAEGLEHIVLGDFPLPQHQKHVMHLLIDNPQVAQCCSPDPTRWSERRMKLNSSLVNVLACCCVSNAACRAQATKKMTELNVIQILNADFLEPEHNVPYLKFLCSAFLASDAETTAQELSMARKEWSQNKLWWDFLRKVFLSKLEIPTSSTTAVHLFEGLLPTIAAYLQHLYDPTLAKKCRDSLEISQMGERLYKFACVCFEADDQGASFGTQGLVSLLQTLSALRLHSAALGLSMSMSLHNIMAKLQTTLMRKQELDEKSHNGSKNRAANKELPGAKTIGRTWSKNTPKALHELVLHFFGDTSKTPIHHLELREPRRYERHKKIVRHLFRSELTDDAAVGAIAVLTFGIQHLKPAGDDDGSDSDDDDETISPFSAHGSSSHAAMSSSGDRSASAGSSRSASVGAGDKASDAKPKKSLMSRAVGLFKGKTPEDEAELARGADLPKGKSLIMQPSDFERAQIYLNSIGALQMVTEITGTCSDAVATEAFNLAIEILWDGNTEVQNDLLNRFNATDERFFHDIVAIIGDASRQSRNRRAREVHGSFYRHDGSNTANLEHKHMVEIFRFLQLMCEGHHLGLQNYLRDQMDNLRSVNVVKEVAMFANELISAGVENNFELLDGTLALLTEMCQGPCKGNQQLLVQSDICTMLSTILTSDDFKIVEPYDSELSEKLLSIKKNAITTLLAVLEGVRDEAIPLAVMAAVPIEKLIDIIEQFVDTDSFKAPKKDDENDENLCELVYGVVITLHTLVQCIESQSKAKETAQEALKTYGRSIGKLGVIEIERNDLIEKVYFRVPAICDYLTEESKDRLIWSVDRSTQGSKLSDFLDKCDELIYDINETAKVRIRFSHNPAMRLLSQFSIQTWDNISLVLAVSINLLFLLGIADARGLLDRETDWFGAEGVIRLLAYWQLFTTALLLVMDGSTNIPLVLYKQEKKIHRPSLLQKATTILARPETLLRLGAVGFSLAGLTVMEYFFAVHLLGLITKSSVLKNVIVAVTQNGKSLVLTAMLGAIVIYLFSIAGFVQFQDHFKDGECKTLNQCVIHILSTGLRQGGGIGDTMKDVTSGEGEYISRLLFDTLFWALMIVIFLNILFGIIIDTFAELRDERNKKEEDMSTRCFVCGLDSYQLDRYGVGFTRHLEEEHNMWNYLYFFHHLKKKQESEFTGQESYVADMIAKGDISFFPAGKCSTLKKMHEDKDTAEEGDSETARVAAPAQGATKSNGPAGDIGASTRDRNEESQQFDPASPLPTSSVGQILAKLGQIETQLASGTVMGSPGVGVASTAASGGAGGLASVANRLIRQRRQQSQGGPGGISGSFVDRPATPDSGQQAIPLGGSLAETHSGSSNALQSAVQAMARPRAGTAGPVQGGGGFLPFQASRQVTQTSHPSTPGTNAGGDGATFAETAAQDRIDRHKVTELTTNIGKMLSSLHLMYSFTADLEEDAMEMKLDFFAASISAGVVYRMKNELECRDDAIRRLESELDGMRIQRAAEVQRQMGHRAPSPEYTASLSDLKKVGDDYMRILRNAVRDGRAVAEAERMELPAFGSNSQPRDLSPSTAGGGGGGGGGRSSSPTPNVPAGETGGASDVGGLTRATGISTAVSGDRVPTIPPRRPKSDEFFGAEQTSLNTSNNATPSAGARSTATTQSGQSGQNVAGGVGGGMGVTFPESTTPPSAMVTGSFGSAPPPGGFLTKQPTQPFMDSAEFEAAAAAAPTSTSSGPPPAAATAPQYQSAHGQHHSHHHQQQNHSQQQQHQMRQQSPEYTSSPMGDAAIGLEHHEPSALAGLALLQGDRSHSTSAFSGSSVGFAPLLGRSESGASFGGGLGGGSLYGGSHHGGGLGLGVGQTGAGSSSAHTPVNTGSAPSGLPSGALSSHNYGQSHAAHAAPAAAGHGAGPAHHLSEMEAIFAGIGAGVDGAGAADGPRRVSPPEQLFRDVSGDMTANEKRA